MTRSRMLDGPRQAMWFTVAAAAAAFFAILSIRVALAPQPSVIDRELQTTFVDHLTHHQLIVMTRLVTYGMPLFAALLVLLAASWLWRRGDAPAVLLLILGPLSALLLGECLVKPLVDRPEGGVMGYPSGHALSLAATSTACLLVAGRSNMAGRPRHVFRVLAGLCAPGLAVLVVLKYHYVTDVVGSALLACAVLPAAAALIDRRSRGARVRRATRPSTRTSHDLDS